MADNSNVVKTGSRKSQLAMIQTNIVVDQLKSTYPDLVFEIETMTTTGDNILNTALFKIGEKALFTKELEIALAENSVDLVVHSLKDLPTQLPHNMAIGAILQREDPRDCIVLNSELKDINCLSKLSPGSVVGTSSLRRVAQLSRNFSHLVCKDVRGNLNTRFKKLDNKDEFGLDALVLACAGVRRMNWQHRINEILDSEQCMYAVGQGAIAVECRADDRRVLELLAPLNHRETILQVVAERAFMYTLQGGCSAPVAVNCTITNDDLTLEGGVFSLDGKQCVRDSVLVHLNNNRSANLKSNQLYAGIFIPSMDDGEMNSAYSAGVHLAQKLQKDGADEILTAIRK